MIRLSKQEELNILYAINPDNFFGEGSSRKVFKFKDKLVKIAIDNGGILQNKNEIYMAQNYPELVANVYAYGDLVLVVEPLDFYTEDNWKPFIDEMCGCDNYELGNFEESWEEYIDYNYDNIEELKLNKELCQAAFDLLISANNILGNSTDNSQMGWSKIDNCFKLYDAGFFCNEDIKVASSGNNYRNYNQIGCIQDYTESKAIECAIEMIEKRKI